MADTELIQATVQAERVLIGSLLIQGAWPKDDSHKEAGKVVSLNDFLDASFTNNRHSRIFNAIISCAYPDAISVAHKLAQQKKLVAGDLAYMQSCITDVPSSIQFLKYAHIVANYAKKRQKPINPNQQSKNRKHYGGIDSSVTQT